MSNDLKQEFNMFNIFVDFSNEIRTSNNNKYSVLTPEEEYSLFTLYKNSSGSDKDEIKKTIMEHNLRLVISIAKKYISFLSHMEMMDLITEGCIGLNRAIELYDLDSGNKFSTYATYWIRQSVQRAIESQENAVRYPAHTNLDRYRVLKFVREYKNENDGQLPTTEEIRKAVKLSTDRFNLVMKTNELNNLASLNTVVLNEHGDISELGEIISDKKQEAHYIEVENNVELNKFMKIIDDIIDSTKTKDPEKMRDIIYKRFGFNGNNIHTLDEIGKMYNVSRERIRQIEATFIRACRSPKNKTRMTQLKEIANY